MIASFGRAMAPKDKRAVQSVETWRIVLACAGMVALTDWTAAAQLSNNLQARKKARCASSSSTMSALATLAHTTHTNINLESMF